MELSKIRILYKAAEAGANDDYVHEKLYENGDFHADEVEAKLKDEELDDLDREAIRKAYQCGFYYGNSREAVRQCVADVLGKKDKKEILKDAAPDLLMACEHALEYFKAYDIETGVFDIIKDAVKKARGEK